MEMDRDKIDDVILALLYLTLARDGRAWKGFNWNSMNRLHEKGFIGDPVNRVKSFWLNEEGIAPSEKLFREMFSIDSGRPTASGSCG
ncbi:DUF6429 family protein [Pseudochelatococcus contaminans]|uniref:DUF6429 family protein n=1 Tax=Pseudochelatococcus contaminans TaxID=1538103 RepID=UPI0016122233|nr:DUF6429 family protein [Pseudochelatococcus contaminans]